MLKWIMMVVSFVAGKLNASGRAPFPFSFETVFLQGRKLALLLNLSLIFVLVLVASFMTMLVEGALLYDANGALYPSALLISSAVVFLVSLGILGVVFSEKTWAKAAHRQIHASEETSEKHRSAIEEAVTLLIHDFIKEREFSREQRRVEAEVMAETRVAQARTTPFHSPSTSHRGDIFTSASASNA